MATFVLVHGAWHGAWCWRRVARLLTAQAHEVFTPTLTGVAERRHIFGQLERGELIDEARRHIERELDLREAELLRNIPGAVNHED